MSAEIANYPLQRIGVAPFPAAFDSLFPQPPGFITNHWPPQQVEYLRSYLEKLDCKTVLAEDHYVDRDYIFDLSVFYARSLRNYPNYCRRIHFFSRTLTEEAWDSLFTANLPKEKRQAILADLGMSYLGFTVIKPLPGSPIGRTVLRTYAASSEEGNIRLFQGTRQYSVHLAGLEFFVEGLAFQQQDQGVSACATTALWSSLQKVAHDEHVALPTPAHITEAASRYLLAEGRSLPSDGLNIQQMCEAIRGAGLQPIVVKSVSYDEDRAQIAAYINSGFPPVLAIQAGSASGHAVCAVGIKMDKALPALPDKASHVRMADALKAVYVHDDRLGPYAVAELQPHTIQPRIMTALQIKWPDKTDSELSVLKAIIIPVPDKIRMPIARILAFGSIIAESTGMIFEKVPAPITLSAVYKQGTHYRKDSFEFGLSDKGLSLLCRELALPRFLGVVEIGSKDGPLFDVLLDTTETKANPSALAFVKRNSIFSAQDVTAFVGIANLFGATAVV